MKPGDLVAIKSRDDPQHFPPRTIGVLLEVYDVDERDGPNMLSCATALVDGAQMMVWLWECELVSRAEAPHAER